MTYLRKEVQIWWDKNDTAPQHIGNMKMILASMTEKEYIRVKKCRFGGSKKTHIGNLKLTREFRITNRYITGYYFGLSPISTLGPNSF
jgi:hypothetical protein